MIASSNGCAIPHNNPRQNAGEGCSDFMCLLVGINLDQGLVETDGITGAFEPSPDLTWLRCSRSLVLAFPSSCTWPLRLRLIWQSQTTQRTGIETNHDEWPLIVRRAPSCSPIACLHHASNPPTSKGGADLFRQAGLQLTRTRPGTRASGQRTRRPQYSQRSTYLRRNRQQGDVSGTTTDLVIVVGTT
jgi:hypothetical protein